MPVGRFRSEEGWVQVDYATGNIPIPRSMYEENKSKPDFDKPPSEGVSGRKMMPGGPKGKQRAARQLRGVQIIAKDHTNSTKTSLHCSPGTAADDSEKQGRKWTADFRNWRV